VATVRYYFNLTDGEEEIRDEEGIELSDVDAAVHSAIQAIKEIRQEDTSAADEWRGWRLEIVDDSGQLIESISLDTPFRN
jgi:hypothetical protein